MMYDVLGSKDFYNSVCQLSVMEYLEHVLLCRKKHVAKSTGVKNILSHFYLN